MSERLNHHVRKEGSVDVAVVGAGVAGLSTAWELTRRGHRVVVCEQYGHQHKHGSSHGSSRILRLAYPQADYVRLAQQAIDGWRMLEEASGTCLFHATGAFDMGSESVLSPIEAAIESAGASVERLDRDAVAVRFGQVNMPEDWYGLLQPDGGVVHAHDALEALIRLCADAGTEVCFNRRVISVVEEDDHVALETDEGTLRADAAVVCAGGWAESLLASLDVHVPIRVTKEHVAYFKITSDVPSAPFIWHTEGGTAASVYGLPRRAGDHVFKVGCNLAGPEVRIEHHVLSGPDSKYIDAIADFLRQHMPCFKPEPLIPETCLYASTPDDDFIIDRQGRVVFGIGLGGHGFKFGPVLGALIADIVEAKSIDLAARFGLARFAAVQAGK
jgi:sarcosine oxidase